MSSSFAQAPAIAWQAFFDGSLPGIDEANAMVIAPDNSIYVTGASANIAPQGTITTIHYAPDGTQLWADHPYGPSQDTQNKGVDMALDPWGHVFVCGNISNNSGDLALIKYGSTGRIWKKNFEQYATADVPDEALALAVDMSGNAYLAGYITSTSGMGLDNYTLKIDTAGNELWHDDFALSSADEIASSVAISPAGNVYVGGHWWNVGGNSGIDMSTVRFDPNGTRVWDEGHEAPASNDKVLALTATATDGVVACGTSMGTTSMDALVIARDATGAELWTATYAGSGNVDDEAVQVKEMNDGKVALLCHSRELVNGSLRHAITTMVIDAGNLLWTDRFYGDALLGAWPTDLKVDANNNLIISGYAIAAGGATTDGVLLKYNPSGTLTWSLAYDGGSGLNDRFNAVGINAYGDVVACGTAYDGAATSRYVTVQFGNAVGLNEKPLGHPCPAVFPNPASTTITVDASTASHGYEVFDALGQRMPIENPCGTIHVTDWEPGIYFLKSTGDEVGVTRFAVQH